MSKTQKIVRAFQSGAELTPRQISGTFGYKNPHDAIYQLRSQGYCIYGNKATLSDGTETVKYRLGKPSKKMVQAANAILGASAFSR